MSVTRDLKRRLKRFEPCRPRPAKEPPAGPCWVLGIKHDGFRIIAQRDAAGLRLITRNGYDLTDRFTLAAAAFTSLPARSCVVDGEAIAVNDSGLSTFDLIHYRCQDHPVTLCAFDLLELDGMDLRRAPTEERKRTLTKLLRRSHPGIALNEPYEGEGASVYKHACALGCEGIASQRLGAPYRPGRVDHSLKIKNPAAPAAKREAEEDWGRYASSASKTKS